MFYKFKKIIKFFGGVNLSKRQLEKIADQLRLLSWALGAILISTTSFHLKFNFGVATIIGLLWIFLQLISLMLDKRSEQK